jgi:glucose-6-phosphate 1-epimerase
MNALKLHEIPGRVTVSSGNGGLPVVRVRSDFSTAEIYPHGAHVTGFQKHGEAPLLFMSAASEFLAEKPIRGGVPVIFPWFGSREGMVAHGFARLAEWDLVAASVRPLGAVKLSFQLPTEEPYKVTFDVTVGSSLIMELGVHNTADTPFTFETCLHTYFQIGDIRQLRVSGLQGTRYHDQLLAAGFAETADAIRFSAETDRTYQETSATVAIIDPVLDRAIIVSKTGSKSTVVWNPWIAKSQRMPDFGDDEYLRMVCVESGNVSENSVTLAPGEEALLTVEVSSFPLTDPIGSRAG